MTNEEIERSLTRTDRDSPDFPKQIGRAHV